MAANAWPGSELLHWAAVLQAPLSTLLHLAGRRNGGSLDEADRRALAIALGKSRFFEYAGLVIERLPHKAWELDELLAYQAFRSRVARVNGRFFPLIAKGLRGYTAEYDQAIFDAARPLWAALQPKGANAFAPDQFFSLIRERFGAEGYLGTTVGFYGMLMGHTIFEGRHALDHRYFAGAVAAMPDDEREFRGKLSEVTFSSNPKLAIANILGAHLDETSNHGLANKRVRHLIVDWMQAHRPEIAGLDARLPLILQVDRLTDPQLVGVLQAAEPLAKERR